MARWQPDARGRLEAAAVELFRERGFEQTTVTDIAARAGLDKRTFYRLFGDKREALFSGRELLEEVLVKAVAETDAVPFEAVIAAFHRVADEIFADRLDLVRVRQSIIEASPELQERELRKTGSLAAAIAAALRAKGVGETTATLATESGVTVFRVAFARWVAPGRDASLTDLITEVAAELRAVTSAPAVPAPNAATPTRRSRRSVGNTADRAVARRVLPADGTVPTDIQEDGRRR